MAQAHEAKEMKYEEALKRLEKLVAELDRSELDLETRLKKFEEGTKLARMLLKKLDQAKKRVELRGDRRSHPAGRIGRVRAGADSHLFAGSRRFAGNG